MKFCVICLIMRLSRNRVPASESRISTMSVMKLPQSPSSSAIPVWCSRSVCDTETIKDVRERFLTK